MLPTASEVIQQAIGPELAREISSAISAAESVPGLQRNLRNLFAKILVQLSPETLKLQTMPTLEEKPGSFDFMAIPKGVGSGDEITKGQPAMVPATHEVTTSTTEIFSRDEIFEKVKEVLVEALGLDDDEVTPTARLQADLGTESIDFLDIRFRLERVFGIKISQSELFPEELLPEHCGYSENGRATAAGIAYLREKLVFAGSEDFATFENDPQIENVEDFFTVQFVINFIASKLGS